MPTKVQICFFKPTGYEDTYIVDTEHRGHAALAVMGQIQDAEFRCINSIVCNLISEDQAIKMLERKEARPRRIQVDGHP